jgi:hypothetical protein
MVCDLLQKIEMFHAVGTQMIPPHGPEIVKSFYDILKVLDSKGLALLAFDGIVVAATTFAAEKGGVFHRRGMARWLAILIIILSLAAAALCLFVSEISYSFFHYVDCTDPDKLDFPRDHATCHFGRLAHRLLSNRLVVLDDRNSVVLHFILGFAQLDK